MTNPLVAIRREVISRPVLKWLKNVLPQISDTEREALEAGTVWWDAELFSGKPDWQKLFDLSRPELTAEEQAFLDGPLNYAHACGIDDIKRRLEALEARFGPRFHPDAGWDLLAGDAAAN